MPFNSSAPGASFCKRSTSPKISFSDAPVTAVADNGGMADELQTARRPKARDLNELVRYTMWSVFRVTDRGALEATRSAVVSFSYAFTHGDTGPQLRGAWLDVMNRNFVRRLHHHAMTALEQGIFLVDRGGVIRHRTVVGPTEPVPRGKSLAEMVHTYCPGAPRA